MTGQGRIAVGIGCRGSLVDWINGGILRKRKLTKYVTLSQLEIENTNNGTYKLQNAKLCDRPSSSN